MIDNLIIRQLGIKMNYIITENEEGVEMLVEESSPVYGYTYADYLKWKIEERLELFRGRIFKLAAPNTKHQTILGDVHVIFRKQITGNLCTVFIAPFDVRLPVKNCKKDEEVITVVQPDICVVCDADKIDERGCCGAPDLIVEILSPGNSKKEVRLKFELYEEAGVKEYWIINPVEQNLFVYCLGDDNKFGGGKMYADGDIVQSFAINILSVNVSEIFAQ